MAPDRYDGRGVYQPLTARFWIGRVFVALAAALVLGLGVTARVDQTVTQPYLGVTYIDRVERLPRDLHVRVVQIDLRAPGIRLKLSAPAGAREVVRETTLEFLTREGAQIAVNAHFFWPFPSPEREVEVIGLAASDGRVYSGFESPVQSYAIVANAPAINIDARNRAGVVNADPARIDGKGVVEPVELWTAVSGSAQIVTGGLVTVPMYRDATHPLALLIPGGPGQYSNERSWYDAINARTAIGLSRDARVLTLFTVDARGGSAGMSVREVAAMLVADYGVWDALNLDGGGSTSLAMVDPVTRVASLVNARRWGQVLN